MKKATWANAGSATAIAFISTMILNVGGFGYHAIAGRRLSVAEYGSLYALVSIFALATVPQTIISPVIARFAAEFHSLNDVGRQRSLFIVVLRGMAVLLAFYVVLAFALEVPLAGFFHVPAWTVPFMAIVSGIGGTSLALRAFATGSRRFVLYGASMAVEGLAKVGIIAAVSAIALQFGSAVLSFGASVLLGAVTIAFPVMRETSGTPSSRLTVNISRLLISIGAAAATGFTIVSMSYADILLVKHFFAPDQAGLYAAASLGGKVLLFFVGFVPNLLIPFATARRASGQRTRYTILLAAGFVFIASLISLAVFSLFGSFILQVLVGKTFVSAAPLLTQYSIAMAFLAMTSALASYGIATHRLAFSIPIVVGTAGTLASIVLAHPSPQVVVQEMVVGNAVTCVAGAVAIVAQGLRELSRQA